ncbi:MAG: transcriptional regulator, BadM/Rrf2 family [Clostridiales bacterium]|nr:transcriptional regulator, BadM/Rrf2 family [Clostridiales bacterium]
MRLSTKGEYGLRAMFELAKHYGKGPLPLKVVAERQDLSEPYLEQLFGILRRGGLVQSVRGAQGGYVLSKSPSSIKIGDIIRVLEGPIVPVDCVSDENDSDEACVRFDNCIARNVWEKVRKSITDVLDSMTLESMLKEYQDTQNDN